MAVARGDGRCPSCFFDCLAGADPVVGPPCSTSWADCAPGHRCVGRRRGRVGTTGTFVGAHRARAVAKCGKTPEVDRAWGKACLR